MELGKTVAMRRVWNAFGWSSFLTFVALAVAGVATLFYVHTTVSDIRDGLVIDVLREDGDIGLAVQHMADLRQAVHAVDPHAWPDGRELLDERLRRAEVQLSVLDEDYQVARSLFADRTVNLAAPALAELRHLLARSRENGAAPTQEALDSAMAELGETYQSLRNVYTQANAASRAALERNSQRLHEFRDALILAFLLVGTLLVTLFGVALVYQRHQRRADEARGLLREAVNSSADGFAIFDAVGRLVLCNARYATFFPGMRSSIRPGRCFSDIIRESVAAGDLAIGEGNRERWLMERLNHFKSPPEAPFENQLRDGRTLRVSERRLRNGSVVSVVSDVTELRRGERELREIGDALRHNNMLLDAALENMGQGLVMFDSQFRLVVCNRRYLEIFGFDKDLGKPGTTLECIVRACHGQGLSSEGLADVLDWRRDVARLRNEITDTEFLRDGRVIELHHRPLADGGSLATYDDITERHRSQEALRHAKEEAEIANRTKSEFLANISHELRTPLNAVIGFSEVLEGEMFGALGDFRYKTYAQDIQDSGRHLLSLINDILDLSKVESGNYALHDDQVELKGIAIACLRVVASRARQAKVALKEEIPAHLPPMRGDERAMKQILLNLLSNAVKFTPADGEVLISAAMQPEGGLSVSVKDTGIGIAKENIDKALSPFGQVDSRLARKYEGTGLGLPLTKRLAELHGGWLTIDSTIGEGTQVTIGFPADRIWHPPQPHTTPADLLTFESRAS